MPCDRSVEIDLRTWDSAALAADLSAGTVFGQQASFHLYTSPFAIDSPVSMSKSWYFTDVEPTFSTKTFMDRRL